MITMYKTSSKVANIAKCFRQNNVRTIVKNSTPILYGDEVSPPVRFVQMTAALLGAQLKYHAIDLFQNQNKTEFFSKINPLQKVPALQVGEEVICDSHAIALYLCRSLGPQAAWDLYPNDLIIKSRIDQILFYESGSLFPFDNMIFSHYFAGKQTLDKEDIDKWHSLLDHLERQLNKYKWLAGDKISLCDICCVATVSSLQLLIPQHERHVKIEVWMDNFKKIPCFEINSRGLQRLKSMVDVGKTSK